MILTSTNESLNKTREGSKIIILEFDGGEAMIPQADIISFENAYNSESHDSYDNSVASISIKGQLIPVFCLSGNYELLDYVPDTRAVCIVVGINNKMIAILFDKIKNLDFTEIKIESLPECMGAEETPVSNILLYRQNTGSTNIGLLLRSQSLVHYITNCHTDEIKH